MNRSSVAVSTSRTSRLSAILAALALVGSVGTLTGWAFDVQRLADWDLDGIAQMPNSAIGVFAAAAALLCASFGRRPAARALGAFAALIAMATLFEYATRIDLAIDRLVFYRPWGQTGTVAHGRMGPPGAVALAIVGISIVLGTFRRTRSVAIAGGLLMILIGMLSLIGYLFGADRLYAIPRLTTIALQTSTMMLILGAALVASVPDRAPIRLLLADSGAGQLFRRSLPAILVLPVGLGWLRTKGQEAGLFDTAFGTALLVVTLMLVLAALLWWGAAAMSVHEEALRTHRDRLAVILSSITDAFITVDVHWRLVFVNDAARQAFGESQEELPGRNLWEILPPADGDEVHRQFHRAMSERSSVDFEAFYPSWQRWYAHRAYPTAEGGLAVYSRDVTGRKHAEQAVRESEEKFSLMFEKAAFGAALARFADGVFVDVNEAFEKMFGYTRAEVLGRSFLHLGIDPDSAIRAQMLVQVQREGGARDLEMRLVTRSGAERVIVSNTTIVTVRGEKHLLTTLQDITERKAGEEALRKSAEALVAADRMKDEFLATLSHELRTPLTAIIGWSDILLHTDLDKDEQHVALETIRSSARAQAQLIEDVLDVSRIITGKMRLDRAEASLAAVIDAAVATVRPAAEGKRIALQVRLDRALPSLFVDAERLRQVAWNLLSNAIKFSPEGTAVDVILRADGDFALIEIADQGRGIAPDFLPHLFERFRQADSSPTRAHAGLGIGLALSKDLVELHGGRIEVVSEENAGSRFTVRLPLVSPGQSDETRQRQISKETSLAPLDGVRVLYVDDREDARLLIGRMLEQHGAEVCAADSVGHALVALARERPHVVVTDLAMPGRDGYDLLAAIRSDRQWDRLPIVALTAQARMGDEALASGAGFRMFLRKPIESHELSAALAQAVAESALDETDR